MKELVLVELRINSCDFWQSLGHVRLGKHISCTEWDREWEDERRTQVRRYYTGCQVLAPPTCSLHAARWLICTVGENLLKLLFPLSTHVWLICQCSALSWSWSPSTHTTDTGSVHCKIIINCTVPWSLTESISQFVSHHSGCPNHHIVTFIILHFQWKQTWK